MYSNKVEICGVNTAKLPVLMEKEKMELLRRCRQGDRQAREELVSGNLRLVLSVVQKFSNRGENLDDLFQVGCIGLMKAIDNFNPELDVRFSTYGVPMIVGEIRRFLRDNNAIRVSRSMRDTAYRARPRSSSSTSLARSRPSSRLPSGWSAKRKRSCWRWSRWWTRFHCMSRSIRTAETPSM